MRVGFTGTRKGLTVRQWRALRQWLEVTAWPGSEITEAHHGACLGADAEFVLAVMDTIFCKIVAHPSDIKGLTDKQALAVSEIKHNTKPPLERNKDIVDSVDILLVGPEGPETLRSGTWSCCRYARRLKKHIVIFHPDGSTTEENKPESTG